MGAPDARRRPSSSRTCTSGSSSPRRNPPISHVPDAPRLLRFSLTPASYVPACPRQARFPGARAAHSRLLGRRRAPSTTLRAQLATSEKRFSFIDGPITANNPMGVHHAWGRTYKDLYQRYKAMTGHNQRWQNGFDCQGLWVEVEVENELGFTNKRDIEKLRHRRVRPALQGPRAEVRPRHQRAKHSSRPVDGLGRLVLHDVGREQLHHLAGDQDAATSAAGCIAATT